MTENASTTGSQGSADMDRIIKIDSWPQAVVAVAGVLGIVGAVVALAHAGMPLETIIGAVMALLGISGGQLAIVRRTGSVEAKNDQQSAKLDTIVKQTNGISDADRERLADEAADRAAVKVIDAYRRGAL
jgi:hypothetical protein